MEDIRKELKQLNYKQLEQRKEDIQDSIDYCKRRVGELNRHYKGYYPSNLEQVQARRNLQDMTFRMKQIDVELAISDLNGIVSGVSYFDSERKESESQFDEEFCYTRIDAILKIEKLTWKKK